MGAELNPELTPLKSEHGLAGNLFWENMPLFALLETGFPIILDIMREKHNA